MRGAPDLEAASAIVLQDADHDNFGLMPSAAATFPERECEFREQLHSHASEQVDPHFDH